jgi:uncharacterized protein
MSKKKVRILCLDGGGIRGIIPATIMQYVEEKLIKLSNNPNARISDYFDMIVGTSTGAILGCFYLLPHPNHGDPNTPSTKFKASEAMRLYTEKGGMIFNESKRKSWGGIRQLLNATRFSPDNIEKIFKENFGDAYFNELLKPCIVTTYDLETQKSFFFNSRELRIKKEERKFLVRDVVRSTSAAPTYFPPAIIKNYGTQNNKMVNIDGGVFANNPTLCAYAEARTTNFETLKINRPTAEDMLILSIGTGSQKLDLKNYRKSGNWGVISWAKTIPDIMMDGGLDTVDYQVNLIFDTLKPEHKTNYKRVNVPKRLRGLDPKIDLKPLYESDMSDASPQNIKNLITAGEESIKDSNQIRADELTLDEFIKKIYDIDLLIKEEQRGNPV